jgi:hypothetical protein
MTKKRKFVRRIGYTYDGTTPAKCQCPGSRECKCPPDSLGAKEREEARNK